VPSSIDEQERCVGYLEGVVDGVDELRVGMGKPACVRAGVEAGQIKDVVVRYLEANPQDRDEDVWILVVTAVGKAWSCNN
jgi:hypothetical protein